MQLFRGIDVRMPVAGKVWRGNVAVIVAALLSCAACATVDRGRDAPAPVEDRGRSTAVPDSEDLAPPADPESLAAPAVPESPPAPLAAVVEPPVRDPVVLALAQEADEQFRRGEPEQAAAALERALRLAPGDAYLWHRLAQLRLEQGRWQQAIVLARKSDALAAGDPELAAANARLIAGAQRMGGRAD